MEKVWVYLREIISFLLVGTTKPFKPSFFAEDLEKKLYRVTKFSNSDFFFFVDISSTENFSGKGNNSYKANIIFPFVIIGTDLPTSHLKFVYLTLESSDSNYTALCTLANNA